uniref:Uncharacterized protein n=1 Tax=viral metagenome TaxID=1070528 RepID=A0A6C0EIC1_9ZZZZ
MEAKLEFITVLSKTVKQDILMDSLNEFYSDQQNLNKLLDIIKNKSKLSLRIIDWYVTNYSKKNNCNYLLNKDSANINFNVYINYKLQLKGYSKKQFDPFCRRERIKFFYGKDDFVVTTVGQLNFFKWAISNNVIDSINKALKVVEKDMNESYKNNIVSNTSKRKELSISASRTITKENIRILVSFD